jgi:membrane-bound serine protease (ClpP class)
MPSQPTWRHSTGAYDIGMTALGVSLLVIGGLMILIEAHVPQLGLIGGPGAVALGVGAALAVGGLGGGLLLGILAALVLVAAAGAVLAVTVGKGLAVRRRAVRAGPEHLIGHVGEVRHWEGAKGSVAVDGALWHARLSWPDDEPPELHVGDPVVVERRHGLTLCVRPAERWELVH